MLKVNLYTAVVSFFLAVMAPVPVALAEERIFFFGNSYSYYNNGMWLMVKALLEEALNTTVETGRNTPNGAKLPRHLADLDGTNGDTAARQALITGNNTSWDLVILQDQSGVPAYTYSDIWWDSLNAGVELNKLIEPTGAVTMFLQTWGRQRGVGPDDFFTEYTKMQDYLTFGYRQYQLAANNPRSFVAPAGIAYQLIYDDTIAAGGSEENSPFRDLYQNDGSHPSKQGSYLAACTIFSAYTGISVAGLEWAPDGIGAERRDYLQSKADEAVFDDDTFYPSRWDLPDFVSPGDKSEATTLPTILVDKVTTSPSSGPTNKPSAAPSDVPSVAPSGLPSETTQPVSAPLPAAPIFGGFGAGSNTRPTDTPFFIFLSTFVNKPASAPGGFNQDNQDPCEETAPTTSLFNPFASVFSGSSGTGSLGGFRLEPCEDIAPTASSFNPFASASSGSSDSTGGGNNPPTTPRSIFFDLWFGQ